MKDPDFKIKLLNQKPDLKSEIDKRLAEPGNTKTREEIEKDAELTWKTYVQYRACNLLHDGEVFYHESQIDFGDNQVGYSNLLNLFSQTCNEKFSQFSSSSMVPENY